MNKDHRRPRTRRTGTISAMTIGLLVLWAGPATAQDAVRIGHNRTWSNPALSLGLASGEFKKAGVDVVEHQFTSPADIISAIASGSLDAGAAPGPSAFISVAAGVKLKIVSVLQGNNNPPIAFRVRSDSNIKSVQDLRGKVAGVNNYGGNHDIYLRYWLARGGLDPQKDVQITVIPVPAMVPALMNNRVDIVPLASIDQSVVEQNYPGKTRTLFDYNDVLMDGSGLPDNNGIVLVMSNDFMTNRHDAAIKFLQGYVRAIRAMNADKKKAVSDWADAIGNDTLRRLDAPPSLPNDGKIYLKSLQFDADQSLRFGYLKTRVDVSTLVDNSLLDEANRTLK